MASTIPHPFVEELLPPLLAHIPIAFSSPQALPSLLPLLAPILRQRVQLLSGGPSDGYTSLSASDSWLRLLTWTGDGAELCNSLANQDFSPHPSGEFEIGDYNFKGVRRSDVETLKAAVELLERNFEVEYVWVEEKEDKDEGAGWKIMDVHLMKDSREEDKWYPTVSAAEEAFLKSVEWKKPAEILPVKETQLVPSAPANQDPYNQSENGDDEDDSYWDMYDRSPARTPAVQHQNPDPSEDEYFARYSNVSPALDRSDASSSPSAYGFTTVPTTTTQQAPPPPQLQPTTILSPMPPFTVPMSPPHSSPSKPASPTSSTPPPFTTTSTSTINEKLPVKAEPEVQTHSPRATSPSQSARAAVDALEQSATIALQAEVGIKQHISTSLKSLYRLARVSGISREEFQRVVEIELRVLEMVEEEEEGGSW
ncbi:hypothetical protein BDZ91DRAFT_723031 [Kalaharituber pfeilii]|nr:hypothetical protein BDZ91DRAFT_723031 [Kalaharituber pfeilii]